MSAARLSAALAYARRGLRVHPCRPDRKLPLLDAWPEQATLDPATVAAWWRRWPDANVAIACGGPARLLVVDVDPDHDGEASLARLEREHGALPATAEVITRSGGSHVYLFVPSGRPMPGNSVGLLGAGIDTRGHGGYVLAPPSTVGGRPYTWSVDCGDRIATAPAWLLALLAAGGGAGKAKTAAEWHKLATSRIAEGERNKSIASLAGLLLRRLPEATLAAELVVAWNLTRCDPPLAPQEVKRTLDSVAAREMRRRGLAKPEARP